jgi:hypothetical protein
MLIDPESSNLSSECPECYKQATYCTQGPEPCATALSSLKTQEPMQDDDGGKTDFLHACVSYASFSLHPKAKAKLAPKKSDEHW